MNKEKQIEAYKYLIKNYEALLAIYSQGNINNKEIEKMINYMLDQISMAKEMIKELEKK